MAKAIFLYMCHDVLGSPPRTLILPQFPLQFLDIRGQKRKGAKLLRSVLFPLRILPPSLRRSVAFSSVAWSVPLQFLRVLPSDHRPPEQQPKQSCSSYVNEGEQQPKAQPPPKQHAMGGRRRRRGRSRRRVRPPPAATTNIPPPSLPLSLGLEITAPSSPSSISGAPPPSPLQWLGPSLLRPRRPISRGEMPPGRERRREGGTPPTYLQAPPSNERTSAALTTARVDVGGREKDAGEERGAGGG